MRAEAVAEKPTRGFVRKALRRLLTPLINVKTCRLSFQFSDGSVLANAPDPEITVVFRSAKAERRSLVLFPDGFIDAWVDGGVDIHGDTPITKLAEAAHAAFAGTPDRNMPVNPLIRARQIYCEWRDNNRSKEQARRNADHHYAMDPRFFEYMLGATVGYSEGLWVEGTRTLDQAKANLYEYVCRKLQLKPGERVLEVGSGWGYMPILMAKKFGCEVTVYNPVRRQNDYMRERFKRQGVNIRLVEADHRDIAAEPAAFDKFVTIGVHEHCGRSCYKAWAHSIATALKPGGIGLISTTNLMHFEYTNNVITRRVFPGGHIPSLPHTLQAMDECGLSIVEIESLWPHYRRTLMEWSKNVQANWPAIQALDPAKFGESFRRLWSFYLDGTVDNFAYALDLSHILFSNGRNPAAEAFTHRQARAAADFATGEMRIDPLR